MKPLLFVALLACAISNSARAADLTPAELCVIHTGQGSAICFMNNSEEKAARSEARVLMRDCATEIGRRVRDCPAILAYIKERWGVP